MIRFTINDQTIEVQEGTTVLRAAEKVGINIPTLCDHPDLTPYGGCRLCLVEVEGIRYPQTACTLVAAQGMIVQTESDALTQDRQIILEMLLSNYFDAGYKATQLDTQFIHWAKAYGLDPASATRNQPRFPIDQDPNPFLWVDFNKCILCMCCVRACAEIQGRDVWGAAARGIHTHIIAGADTDLISARCESCGACVAYCPTGALDNKMSMHLGEPDKRVPTICTHCGVGCQLDLNIKDGKVIRVTSNPSAPVNGMALCVKGRYGYDFIHHPDRLKKPMVRESLINGTPRLENGGRGKWVEVDWETALEITAQKLLSFRDTYNSDSIGILTSANYLNEEYYLMNKFARQVIGTNNIDHYDRLCHSSTMAGLDTTFGAGAMTNSMDDVGGEAASMLIIGSNITEQHPVFGAMIRQAVRRRGLKLVVADPRKLDIAEFASLHLQHKPDTDIALINGLIHIILENGWEDRAFIESRTERFEDFRQVILEYSPDDVSSITGIPIRQLYQAAEILALNRPMAVVYAMDINQHNTGVPNVMSLVNLQMLLGNIGIPGGGVNPLCGQINGQGARDMGGLPNVYSDYQDVTLDEIQKKFEARWGVPLSNQVGMTTTEMIRAAGEGKVKALYILGEDLLMGDPDTANTRRCLDTCDFLVLQSIYPTETENYADVLLPGVSFAEKTGTVTNTERRVQMVRKAIEPLGEARPDWWITMQIAHRILEKGNRKINRGSRSAWNYSDTSEIMSEIAALTPSYAGISYERLERGDRLQWPVVDENHPGTPILHRSQFTRGRGRFVPLHYALLAEPAGDE